MERFRERFREEKAAREGEVLRLNGSVNGDVAERAEALRKMDKETERLHESMLSRLDFYKVKLKGLENYIIITLERLKVQREAVRILG